MIRFGVIGLGVMGRTHLANLARGGRAEPAAVADIDPRRLEGGLAPGGGNIDTGGAAWAASRVRRYMEAGEVFQADDIDAVVIATPSDLHAPLARAALAAGKHVFCEKPMALSVADADAMLAAARAADRRLMIGHCIRFWGEYAAATEAVRSGRFGALRSACFTRRCSLPGGGEPTWFADAARSGGALLDLHIHDVDYVVSVLGPPRSVMARGRTGPSGGIDEVVAWYDYGPDGPLVQIDGGWDMGEKAPFFMRFRMMFERATLSYASDRTPTLQLFSQGETIEVSSANAYAAEIDEFVRCVESGQDSEIAPPASSRQSLALALAEGESVRKEKDEKGTFNFSNGRK